MSRFKIVMNVDNSAFEDRFEVRRILRDIIQKLENGDSDTTIRDINGNKIGSWGYTDI